LLHRHARVHAREKVRKLITAPQLTTDWPALVCLCPSVPHLCNVHAMHAQHATMTRKMAPDRVILVNISDC
jgi:hypothetical protein